MDIVLNDLVLNLKNLSNHGNQNIELFWFSLLIVSVLSLVMMLAYASSKTFIKIEFEKLQENTVRFDKYIILASGIAISAVVVAIGILITSIAAQYFCPSIEQPCYLYMRLMVIFSAALVIGYVVAAPDHAAHRLMDVSDEAAKAICNKIARVVIVSFLIAAITYSLVVASYDIRYKLILEHIAISVIIVYYFVEIALSRKEIFNWMGIHKAQEYIMSERLASFVNDKVQYFALVGMIYIVSVNFAKAKPGDFVIFVYMNSICFLLVEMFIFQWVISLFINKFLEQLDHLNGRLDENQHLKSRMKNLVWICDIIVLSAYFVILCVGLSYSGVDVRRYVFHDNMLTLFLVIFITATAFKGFQEYKETILDKAKKDNDAHYVRLKTFMPTISAIFYSIVTITSLMIGLSSVGINVTPVLAVFSLFGAAAGFAATDIIKSFLYGIILLVEKNLLVGDYVRIGTSEGIIERLSVRVLYLRGCDNNTNVIPYSQVRFIEKLSRKHFEYKDTIVLSNIDDVEKAKKILLKIVDDMKRDGPYKDIIIGDIVIHGIKPFDMSGVKIYWAIKTNDKGKYVVHEVYNVLLKEFKKHNIEIPIASSVSVNV